MCWWYSQSQVWSSHQRIPEDGSHFLKIHVFLYFAFPLWLVCVYLLWCITLPLRMIGLDFFIHCFSFVNYYHYVLILRVAFSLRLRMTWSSFLRVIFPVQLMKQVSSSCVDRLMMMMTPACIVSVANILLVVCPSNWFINLFFSSKPTFNLEIWWRTV